MTTKQEVLQSCRVEGNIIKLPDYQLDRKLYLEVAKALTLIGGTWKGGKTFGFVFSADPTELLEHITNEGNTNTKKEYQFFATPAHLAEELVSFAELTDEDTILEPSAGQGAIINAINNACTIVPDCYELMPTNAMILRQSSLKFNLLGDDFLRHRDKKYSKIIANPPFSNNQDIDHIRAMYNTLSIGGRLVSLASPSWTFGNQKKQYLFKEWLENEDINALVLDVPKGTFKESGTMIESKIVIINKTF